MKPIFPLVAILLTSVAAAADPVTFNSRTRQNGRWSDVQTWEHARLPQQGDFVQIRAGHTVVYDVESSTQIRMIHVAGVLTFSREVSTLLDVGLIKIEPGETTTEDGFNCHDVIIGRPAVEKGANTKTDRDPAPHHHHHSHHAYVTLPPALEIGNPHAPIPAGIKATIRLRHFKGTDPETLPSIVACGGRFDVHGAPLKRTWVKLAAPARVGDRQVTVEQPLNDWRMGDRVIVTTGGAHGPGAGHTFQKRPFAQQKLPGTEECRIGVVTSEDKKSVVIPLDRALEQSHQGEGWMRCEIANLSRNVVIESAEAKGVRGHTMYHAGSSGGISYAEFRHLGKEGVLGKYPIHFHLVRDTMRGSGVLGASIWDSHNRWITIHGTDHLLVRDCVGYQSRGHGYFLEDATEQWNVLDRNLAVQAFSNIALPKQVLPYDPNDGAGFWWANGRNTLTRNVACENDRYGYHFQIAKTANFDPTLDLSGIDGTVSKRDVRTIPLLRFEENESHSEGLFDFRFGDEEQGSVQGDRLRPFIAKNLLAWQSHYAIRPNIRCFFLDGLRVQNAAFGIYHPNFDLHVYRDIQLQNISGEPINGGHDEESVPHGDFTFERLTLSHCKLQRDPLIQLTGNGPKPDLFGHFRSVTVSNSSSVGHNVVDFGGGPRTNRVDNPIKYYFHDLPNGGLVTQVASLKFPAIENSVMYAPIKDWTGPEAVARQVTGVDFPELLTPTDDLPPATLITRVTNEGKKRRVMGVSHDNGEIAKVMVNGQSAEIVSQQAGVADWSIVIDTPQDNRIVAKSFDREGNSERTPHEWHISTSP